MNMKWHYRCPICHEWRNIDWDKRDKTYDCHKNEAAYIPPTPSEQNGAFVNTQEWPEEIEMVVVTLKGDLCTIPGCNKKYETLDHRIPYSKGGRTSVDNLWPMCNEHNQSKGDSDYDEWLKEL